MLLYFSFFCIGIGFGSMGDTLNPKVNFQKAEFDVYGTATKLLSICLDIMDAYVSTKYFVLILLEKRYQELT